MATTKSTTRGTSGGATKRGTGVARKSAKAPKTSKRGEAKGRAKSKPAAARIPRATPGATPGATPRRVRVTRESGERQALVEITLRPEDTTQDTTQDTTGQSEEASINTINEDDQMRNTGRSTERKAGRESTYALPDSSGGRNVFSETTAESERHQNNGTTNGAPKSNGVGPVQEWKAAATPLSSTRRFVRAGDIRIDPTYQRSLSRTKVDEIKSDFDADAFGIPLVGDMGTEGIYAIDGQHRIVAAVELWGVDVQIECEVKSGMDATRAAQLFRKRNDSRTVTPMDKYLAGVTAGDAECVAVDNIVRQCGLEVKRGSSTNPNILRCVTSLLNVYRGFARVKKGEPYERHPEELTRTLVILGEAFGANTSTFTSGLVSGLGMVLIRYGREVKTKDMIQKLATYPGGAARLLGAARGLMDSMGGSLPNAVATAIVHRYNTGRRGRGRLTDWNIARDF